ncbi:MAG: bis(5'-nucleosyl)-tetraphosphatase (symmetrical) YqeK [Thermotogaceae bacterium]|nr:bis(5'-nucleosyl)-tetraphosphatase (symmetrical) YqeK [Thermotogaceae bacterium]
MRISAQIIGLFDILLTRERKRHIFAVKDFALKLAAINKVNPFKVEIAALSHDLFRDVPPNKLLKLAELWEVDVNDEERVHPVLLHGKVAAEFVRRRFGINDASVLIAISHHTSSHPDFDEIGKIITIADTIGYDRDFDDIEKLRKIAIDDLEEGYLVVLANRIKYYIETRRFVLENTVKSWNKIVERRLAK